MIVAEVDIRAARGPSGRDPAGYPLLAAPTDELPIARILAGPPAAKPLRVAVVAPGARSPLRAVRELAADVAVGTAGEAPEGIVWIDGASSSGSLVDVPGAVAVGVLHGDRGLVPEEVRTQMLLGAAASIWFTHDLVPPVEVLRTRADENRICLLTVGDDGRWTAVGPTGEIVGSGPPEGVIVSLIELPVALTWNKEMAPGTDLVRGRRPEKYADLAAATTC